MAFDFSGFFLPTQLYEQLVCTVMRAVSQQPASSRRLPELFKDCAVFSHGDDQFELSLDMQRSRILLTVVSGDPISVLALVESQLWQIRHETRSAPAAPPEHSSERHDKSGFLLSWQHKLLAPNPPQRYRNGIEAQITHCHTCLSCLSYNVNVTGGSPGGGCDVRWGLGRVDRG